MTRTATPWRRCPTVDWPGDGDAPAEVGISLGLALVACAQGTLVRLHDATICSSESPPPEDKASPSFDDDSFVPAPVPSPAPAPPPRPPLPYPPLPAPPGPPAPCAISAACPGPPAGLQRARAERHTGSCAAPAPATPRAPSRAHAEHDVLRVQPVERVRDQLMVLSVCLISSPASELRTSLSPPRSGAGWGAPWISVHRPDP